MTNILDEYNLKNKIMINSNLSTMTIVVKSILKCEVLGLEESLQVTCFAHDSSTSDEKVCKGFICVSINSTQVDL